MPGFTIDTAPFRTAFHRDPDPAEMALWTFHIDDAAINVWGRYPTAVSTATRYAEVHGAHQAAIHLMGAMDSTGAGVPAH